MAGHRLMLTASAFNRLSMPSILVTGPTAKQNPPFLRQQWPKPSPVLTALVSTEGWPGWVGLSSLDDCRDGSHLVCNPNTKRARRSSSLLIWPMPLQLYAKATTAEDKHIEHGLTVTVFFLIVRFYLCYSYNVCVLIGRTCDGTFIGIN